MVTSREQALAKAVREVEIIGWDDEPFVCRLRTISLMKLASQGKIPNSLLGVAVQLFKGKDKKEDDSKDAIKKMGEMSNLIDLLCQQTMVEPTFEEVGEYLTDEQKSEIFQYSQGGVKALENFRKESSSPVGDEHSEDV